MYSRTPAQHGAAWLTQCMRDVKTQKIQQTVRPYASDGGDALPVRGLVAVSRIHRGEHIGTVKRECVLTGRSATQLLQQTCRGSASHAAAGSDTQAASPSSLLHPVSSQAFDDVVSRIARLPLSSSTPPHLLLSRDALLMTTALYLARSPLHYGVVPPTHPMQRWAAALPRRPPPMGVLLRRHFLHEAHFEPLTRRLRLGQQTREMHPGDDLTAASTELMVQSVESGEVELTALQHPTVETALTTSLLTNYYKGCTTALTTRQHEAQRARSGAAERESDAVHLFLTWEQHLQTQLVSALLPVLLTSSASEPLPFSVLDSPAWQVEEATLRWAHFMVRSRAVNLNWRLSGPPLLSVIPLVDMLNHSPTRDNVVYHCEENGDVALTASQTIQAGEELVLRYNNVGQRGCLFGDRPRPTSATTAAEAAASKDEKRGAAAGAVRAKAMAAAREVDKIEKRQYHELYAQDEDEDEASALNAGIVMATTTPSDARSRNAALANQEMQQEVQWLWRYGFLRSEDEKNREAAQLWSRGLRRRIAHLTDVRRRGRPGEFVIGVPEGLQYLREQRAQLERERYGNHRVFPPQQQ